MPIETVTLQQDLLFADRYLFIRRLGRGGFSEVWLAKDTITGIEIAIKIYAPGQSLDSDGLRIFSSELAKVYHLNHTSLLTPKHVDSWKDMPYLIMDYCSEGSLTKKVGDLSEEQIWHVISDVASGLDYLHRNDIIHQDIKPDNILIHQNGTYVITDFGISMRARSTLRKSMSNVDDSVSSGTMAYMGPERFSAQPAPVKASDIWALGSMIYELIMGDVPFNPLGGGMQKGGADIPEITADVSNELKEIITNMLALNTWERPTADMVYQRAQAHLNHNSISHETAPLSPGKPGFGKPTARIDGKPAKQKTPADNQQPSAAKQETESKPKNKKGLVISIIIGVLLLMAGGGIFIYKYQQNAALRQEASDYQIEQIQLFDQKINSASKDNIKALEESINLLDNIKRAEDNQYIDDDDKMYDAKRQVTLDKCQQIESQLQADYNDTPDWMKEGDYKDVWDLTVEKLKKVKALNKKI